MRRQFCTDSCRKAAWQRKREDTLARLEENLTLALSQIQAIRERRTRPMPTGRGRGLWSKHQSADE